MAGWQGMHILLTCLDVTTCLRRRNCGVEAGEEKPSVGMKSIKIKAASMSPRLANAIINGRISKNDKCINKNLKGYRTVINTQTNYSTLNALAVTIMLVVVIMMMIVMMIITKY